MKAKKDEMTIITGENKTSTQEDEKIS
jgi:hypothetical protein